MSNRLVFQRLFCNRSAVLAVAMRHRSTVALLALAGLAFAGPVTGIANAALVEVAYSTSGTFANSGTNSLTVGSAMITFTGTSQDIFVDTNSGDPAGVFGNWSSTNGQSLASFVNQPFSLTITETIPDSDSGPIAATLSGTLIEGNGGSGVSIDWTGAGTLSLPTPPVGGIPTVNYALYPSSIGSGGATGGEIQNGDITVPEPASFALLSILSVGFLARRRPNCE